MSAELKACPFCGSHGIDRELTRLRPYPYCTNCGANGPIQKATWNTRANLTTPPAADYVAGPAFGIIDPHWGEPEIMVHTIRATEEAAIEAALSDPDLAIYSGASFACIPPIKGKWQ